MNTITSPIATDDTERYYEWLHDHTVDLNAPDYLLQMIQIYSFYFLGEGRYLRVKQAIYDVLTYDIERISDDVLKTAQDMLLAFAFHSHRRYGWLDEINRELQRRDDASRCAECGQLKETCEQYGYMSSGSLYEAPGWVCGKEPNYDAQWENR